MQGAHRRGRTTNTIRKMKTVREVTLEDAMECISGTIKYAMTVFIKLESRSKISWMEIRVQVMPNGLVNKTVDGKLISVEYESRFIERLKTYARHPEP